MDFDSKNKIESIIFSNFIYNLNPRKNILQQLFPNPGRFKNFMILILHEQQLFSGNFIIIIEIIKK